MSGLKQIDWQYIGAAPFRALRRHVRRAWRAFPPVRRLRDELHVAKAEAGAWREVVIEGPAAPDDQWWTLTQKMAAENRLANYTAGGVRGMLIVGSNCHIQNSIFHGPPAAYYAEKMMEYVQQHENLDAHTAFRCGRFIRGLDNKKGPTQ